MRIRASQKIRGRIQLPGDKSISHRYAILGAMARGETRITGYSTSQDCQSTLNCLKQLGVSVSREEDLVTLTSPGWEDLRQPPGVLDAGNSGTTIRLLTGLLAGRPFTTTIHGDESLNRRPMRRIITPLTGMGATIEAVQKEFPPLTIRGTTLTGITYEMPVASAQVKSCVLLAGLTGTGTTTVREKQQSRDHTERAIPVFGGSIERHGLVTSVAGPQRLRPARLEVPGDFSAASFFILASLLLPDSDIVLERTGVNPTRTGLLDLLESSGVSIEKQNLRTLGGEPVCDLRIVHQPGVLENFPAVISGDWIPNVIDEIPVLSVFGARLRHGLKITGASELRKKESDRIATVVSNLRTLGVPAEEFPDGLYVPPGNEFRGGRVETWGDHRIAMAFAVAGLFARDGVELDDPGCVAVSFPGFFSELEAVTRPPSERGSSSPPSQ